MRIYKSYVILFVLLLAGCAGVTDQLNRHVLTELEVAKLEYTTISNDYATAREVVRQQRASGVLSDSAWATFDALQYEIADLALESIDLRRRWEDTGNKPLRWDGMISELKASVEKVTALVR